MGLFSGLMGWCRFILHKIKIQNGPGALFLIEMRGLCYILWHSCTKIETKLCFNEREGANIKEIFVNLEHASIFRFHVISVVCIGWFANVQYVNVPKEGSSIRRDFYVKAYGGKHSMESIELWKSQMPPPNASWEGLVICFSAIHFLCEHCNNIDTR